jgi:hypothetical protein
VWVGTWLSRQGGGRAAAYAPCAPPQASQPGGRCAWAFGAYSAHAQPRMPGRSPGWCSARARPLAAHAQNTARGEDAVPLRCGSPACFCAPSTARDGARFPANHPPPSPLPIRLGAPRPVPQPVTATARLKEYTHTRSRNYCSKIPPLKKMRTSHWQKKLVT